eukprot:5563360-Amphidinium_carterae.2
MRRNVETRTYEGPHCDLLQSQQKYYVSKVACGQSFLQLALWNVGTSMPFRISRVNTTSARLEATRQLQAQFYWMDGHRACRSEQEPSIPATLYHRICTSSTLYSDGST